jgi:general secretion pathway protein A
LYLKHFGFREAPFNLTPDPKFFYSSQLHREALAALYYGIKNKKGFVVVTGEVGTGKTTVLRKLLRSLEATHHSIFIFNTLLTFDELLETMLRDLEINQSGAGRVAMLETLNQFLLEKMRFGHVVSVLIDEAQNLSEDALEGVRLLSNLETDREKLIQIILVGQPELEAKLNRPSLRQLKQRVSLWCRLDCLSVADTESYIRHRINVAGYQGPDLFDASSLKLISEHTAGAPRLINAICDNSLLTAFAGSQKTVTAEIVREVTRDLRLTRESDPANLSEHERKARAQLPPKPMRAELSDVRGRARGRAQEELLERSRMMHGPDVVHNLGLKLDPHMDIDRVSQERNLRRVAANNVSSIMDRRSEAAEPDDISDFDDRNVFGSRRSNVRHRMNDTLVPHEFFSAMAQSLADAMGPMATMVLKERIAGLGESIEEFPVVRLPELVAAIKHEILSEALRLRFEKEIAAQIQEHSKFAIWRSSTK